MSWADEASIRELASTGYFITETDDDDDRFHVLNNGNEICNNCGSQNIKTSTRGNKYCADLCWVEKENEA